MQRCSVREREREGRAGGRAERMCDSALRSNTILNRLIKKQLKINLPATISIVAGRHNINECMGKDISHISPISWQDRLELTFLTEPEKVGKRFIRGNGRGEEALQLFI